MKSKTNWAHMFGTLVVVTLCPFSCTKRRTEKKHKEIRRVGPVPLIPRAQDIKIFKNDKTAVAAEFNVPVPRRRATRFYRVKLAEERWSVQQTEDGERTVMLARRGFYRLRIALRSKGRGQVAIRLEGRRLSEAVALQGRAPPLPPDLKLPANILWDGRILPTTGDDVEFRGRTQASVDSVLEQFTSTLGATGWKANRTKNVVSFQKGTREVTIKAFFLRKNLTSIHVRLNAAEITKAPPPGRTADAAVTRPEDRTNIPRQKPREAAGHLTLPQTPRQPAASPRKIQGVVLPKGWKLVEDSDDLIASAGVRYAHPSRALTKLGNELKRGLKRQGWRTRGSGRASIKGVMVVLIFEKGKQVLTITLKKGLRGATADLLMAN